MSGKYDAVVAPLVGTAHARRANASMLPSQRKSTEPQGRRKRSLALQSRCTSLSASDLDSACLVPPLPLLPSIHLTCTRPLPLRCPTSRPTHPCPASDLCISDIAAPFRPPWEHPLQRGLFNLRKHPSCIRLLCSSLAVGCMVHAPLQPLSPPSLHPSLPLERTHPSSSSRNLHTTLNPCSPRRRHTWPRCLARPVILGHHQLRKDPTLLRHKRHRTSECHLSTSMV